MSIAERVYENPGERCWRGPFVRIHPAWIVLLVLGFIVWWPLGLAILVFTLWSKNMGCFGGDRWQRKMQRMEERVGRLRERMEGFGGGHPSSGNRAFDEYRAETLRRLEEEQREFQAFLERLRFAKDKTEFDQFMAERRNRGGAAPQEQA
ncbi:MAG TPA: DUF2852 domain-containing protein [Xanthobacteraceae bacterium]|nr:DUF2852 domain-containing protein [Xanthobacteraceae bacterium]